MKRPKNPDTAELLQKNLLNVFRQHPYKTFNHKQLLKQLKNVHGPAISSFIRSDETQPEIRNRILEAIDRLVKGNEVVEMEHGKYKLFPQQAHAEGVIDIVSSGAAYVMDEDYEDDIYIAPRNVKNALPGDRVKVFLYAHRRGRRPEGEVAEILERAQTDFAGVVHASGRYAFLVPDNPKVRVDIFIPPGKTGGARQGQKAVARMTEWTPGAKNPVGEIIRVLGMPGDNDAEMNAILVDSGFPLEFPEAVEAEAQAIPERITRTDLAQRKDFRDTPTFTIDPDDAKDFDDALSVRPLADGRWEVGIHIADVSHYVPEDSALDKEAAQRATSIYLVDRVIPMLPEKLSNKVCSLRPDEEKLCYSAVFEMDTNAAVLKQWFGRTIIRSRQRFTYDQAQQVIETGNGPMAAEVTTLHHLAGTLRKQRFAKGAINFEKEEVKFRLDAKGNPLGVYLKEYKDSNKLIEEFMLLANRRVAEFIGKREGPDPGPVRTFVYRVHDSPPTEKLEDFARFAKQFGYDINTSSEKDIALSLNRLLNDIKGKREQNLLEQLAIRAMAKAKYTTDNIGHYGLAFEYYTHFTSPIRRYPDVMVHRLLTHYLAGGKPVSRNAYEKKCMHSTEMEIQASDAERTSVKFKQVQYLRDHIGDRFDGVISGVTEWGIFVELVDNKCEGLVRLRDLEGDYYELDDRNHCIRGMRTRRTFSLGDPVTIEVRKADLEKKQLDFRLIGTPGDDSPRGTARGKDMGKGKDKGMGKDKGKGKRRRK